MAVQTGENKIYTSNDGKGSGTVVKGNGLTTSYCVGFSKFDFHFSKSNNHQIQEISLNMTPTWSGTELIVNVSATFQNSGNKTIADDSYVNVVAAIQTGSTNPNVFFTNVDGISRNQSKTVTVPAGSNADEVLFLSGLYYSYGKKDREITEISAGLSASTASATEVVISGDATMENSHKDIAEETRLNAGYGIEASDGNLYFVYDLGAKQNPDGTEEVTFTPPPDYDYDWDNLIVVVKDFKVAFPKGDHKINTLSVGVDSWDASIDQNGVVTLSLNRPAAVMFNTTTIEDSQENAKSDVVLMAIVPVLG